MFRSYKVYKDQSPVRRVGSQFFLVSPDSQVAKALADLLACLRRGEVLNEKWRKQVRQNFFEGPFCLFCTFIFRNERNWMKKSARVSEKLPASTIKSVQAFRCCIRWRLTYPYHVFYLPKHTIWFVVLLVESLETQTLLSSDDQTLASVKSSLMFYWLWFTLSFFFVVVIASSHKPPFPLLAVLSFERNTTTCWISSPVNLSKVFDDWRNYMKN